MFPATMLFLNEMMDPTPPMARPKLFPVTTESERRATALTLVGFTNRPILLKLNSDRSIIAAVGLRDAFTMTPAFELPWTDESRIEIVQSCAKIPVLAFVTTNRSAMMFGAIDPEDTMFRPSAP